MAELEARASGSAQPAAPARFDAVPTQFGGDGSPQSEPPPLPPQTLGQQVVGGLRDVAMGIPKLAALPADMGVMVVNAGQSLLDPTAQPFRTVSEAADQSLNDMGVPQTRNPWIRGVNEAVGGGAVSIGLKGLQIGREAFAPQAPLQTAAQRRAGRAVREIAGGPDERAILAEQLRNYKSPVSGVNATVAEAVQGMPEGSPLQALQDVVSRVSGAQYGSPSIQFGRQMAGNQAARETAKKALGESHGAVRDSILQSVSDSALGMQLEKIAGGVAGKMEDPRVYANDFASRAYSTFMDDIGKIVKDDGSIDPAALDEVRKSFGPKLSALFQKEGWNVKDAAFAKATRSAQGLIDQAIEAAGGSGYRDELARYSREIGGITDDALRTEEMYNPLQKSTVPLVKLLEDQMEKGLQNVPSFMSPKLWLAKAGAREMFRQSRPGVVNEMSMLLRKPQDMAWALDERNAQGATEALQRALMQYGRRAPGAIGASRE